MSEQKKDKTYFPILISTSNRSCLVVGGGMIAYYKVKSISKFIENITVLAPEIEERLMTFARQNNIQLKYKSYETSDLEGYDLVIAATGKKKMSHQIWQDCKERGILINAIDDPEHCEFILPSTIKRGDLTISIGTQAKAPFLTKEIRKWINRMFTPEWSEVMNLAAEYRKLVLSHYTAQQAKERKEAFDRFLKIDWYGLLQEKNLDDLRDVLKDILKGENIHGEENDFSDESEGQE